MCKFTNLVIKYVNMLLYNGLNLNTNIPKKILLTNVINQKRFRMLTILVNVENITKGVPKNPKICQKLTNKPITPIEPINVAIGMNFFKVVSVFHNK